jgi:predicted ATPase
LSFRLGMTQTTDRPPQNPTDQSPKPVGFTEIGVSGFKSFAEETRIQLGSLTILAGANSSGKSSIMQPLLLMKQTLEAPYDPGALLLDGPNVSFSSGEQIFSKNLYVLNQNPQMMVRLCLESMKLESIFQWSLQDGIELFEQRFRSKIRNESVNLKFGMPSEAIFTQSDIFQLEDTFIPTGETASSSTDLSVLRTRCFMSIDGKIANYDFENSRFVRLLRAIIHVRGLRGNPERVYKTAAVSGSVFIGQFENYVANIIDRFQKENPEQLIKIQEALQKLGLADIVQTQRLNDTQIELRVGRVLGQADPTDTVNIADVGFGVSQVLPVIVALLVAQPGQLVYIEQPEIHLHPRAQIALSEIFADAANRGVRVVVETHSELFLLGVQSLVAEDKLDPKEVKLHWFTRNPDGSSKVTSAELDSAGAFGDWPQDFGMTALRLENRYISAAEAKL